MSRFCNIKLGFFKNEELLELLFEYCILFQGLWCEVDCEGCFEDCLKWFKVEIFFYDNVDVVVGFVVLVVFGFIC